MQPDNQRPRERKQAPVIALEPAFAPAPLPPCTGAAPRGCCRAGSRRSGLASRFRERPSSSNSRLARSIASSVVGSSECSTCVARQRSQCA